MSKKSRVLLILGAVSLFLAVLTFVDRQGDRAYAAAGSDFLFTVQADGTAGITGYQGLSSDVVIPSIVESEGETYPVKRIEASAFMNQRSLTSILIPESVTAIGNSAFWGCSGLTKVNIPSGVSRIEYSTFLGCSSLTAIGLPESVTAIGSSAFSSCSRLAEVNIPDGVVRIESSTFSGCSSLTAIELPESVTSIGDSAFSRCSSLASFRIPSGVTMIEQYTFYGCAKLASLTIPEGVAYIGNRAFMDCALLTALDLPDGLTSIAPFTFSGCKSLTGIAIPAGVTTIGESAFDDCRSLTHIRIPEGVTQIDRYAFRGCAGAGSVELPQSLVSMGESAFENCGLVSVILPSKLTTIEKFTFQGCSKLTNIVVPAGVTRIGQGAFQRCGSLGTIDLPEGLVEIGASAFRECSKLASIEIPAGVTVLEDYVFYRCSSLASITIPSGVTAIGGYAFFECIALKSAYFTGDAPAMGTGVFGRVWFDFSVYYYSGGQGFTMPTWMGYQSAEILVEYGIRFYANGGTGRMLPVVASYYDTNALPVCTFIKSGYAFKGWATYRLGPAVYPDGRTAGGLTRTDGAMVNLYAKWGPPILSAASGGFDSIKISWAAAGNAEAYRIYRAASPTGPYTLVHTSASTERSWVNTGLASGKPYYYKVFTVAGGLTYDHSAYKSAAAVPATPGITVAKASPTSIKVAWTGVAGATKYQVYRAVGAGGAYTLVASVSPDQRAWTNTNLVAGKTYFYKVRATHLEGSGYVYGNFSPALSLALSNDNPLAPLVP